MKCDSCRASWLINNESMYEGGCLLEGYIEANCEYTEDKQGNCGCTIHPKTLKKLMDDYERHQDEQAESYAEWHREQENIIRTCYICGYVGKGIEWATCDTNHNTTSVPCGNTICAWCWEKERRASIYDGKIPNCCQKHNNK